jgi:hypothetical protein
MRTTLPTLSLLILVCGPGRADDAAAVVEKAVQAMAGSDLRLQRLSAIVRTDRGTLNLPAGEVPVQRTVYLCPPDRLKYDATITINGQPQAMVLALSGVNGWQSAGKAVKDLSPAEFDVMLDEAYAQWLITLLPLRQKGVTPKSLPPITLAGKPAVGVSVSRPNRSDSQIYFDAATGLPVRVKMRVREGSLDVAREYELAGHKDFDGIKLPTRITVLQNGKKIEDWTVQDYRTPDQLDDRLFKKP